MDTSAKRDVMVAERATRRMRTLEEKLRILEEAARPGASLAAVARRHAMNANLLFAWRRMQRRGLLEGQRHAPALLPVQVTMPTVTPTRRMSGKRLSARAVKGASAADSRIEICLAGQTRIVLHGSAHSAVLATILSWLAAR